MDRCRALEKLLAIAEHVNDATERAYSIAKIIELRHTIQGLQNVRELMYDLAQPPQLY